MSSSRQGISSSPSFSPTASFVISEEPTMAEMSSDTIFYYGFLAFDGGWYIQRRDTVTGQNRYATGSSGYTAAIANKASLEYDRFDTVFGR